MRRNNRGALWALGLAGASYLWRNRARLQQQAGRFRSNQGQRLLPDFGFGRPQQQRPEQNESWSEPRRGRFGGTDV